MRFYTGSYTRLGGPGIGICHWDGDSITMTHTARDLHDPTFIILSKDAGTLFAVGSDHQGSGVAASYSVCGDELTLLSMQHTGGKDACHLTLSPDERYLYAANYLNGSISVFPVKNGVLLPSVQHILHEGSSVNPVRQASAHVHQCIFRPGMRELFVCDLGSDQVVVYAQDADSGLLSRKESIPMPGGMGPRHLVFADADCFYVTGELDNRVRRCILEENRWTIRQEISTLPLSFHGVNYSAAIRLHAGALYVTNRGHDSLCRIALDESGKMTCVDCTPTGGVYPRDFAVTPNGMLFAHQISGGIVSCGASLPMPGAVCICVDASTL